MLLIICFLAFPSQELFCFSWERRNGCFCSEVIEKLNKTPETGERSCCEMNRATYRKCCTSVLCVIFLLCMGYCSRSFRPCLLVRLNQAEGLIQTFCKMSVLPPGCEITYKAYWARG